MKLHTRLALYLLPLLLAPLLAVSWLAYGQLNEQTSAKSRDSLAKSLDTLVHAWQQMRDMATTNSDLFAQDRLTKRYAAAGDDTERYSLLHPALLTGFRAYQKVFPEYYELRFLLSDGFEDARSTVGRIINHSDTAVDQPWFDDVRKDPHTHHDVVARNPDDGRWSYYHYRRIQDARGRSQGYLALTVSLEALEKRTYRRKSGLNGWMALFDSTGEPVMASDGKQVRTSLEQEPRWRELLKSQAKEHLIEGERFLMMTTPLDPGLHAVAALPRTELDRPLQELSLSAGVITALALILTTSLLLFIVRHLLVRPLSILRDATHAIGEGNLQPDIQIRGEDELGDLARTVREMGGKLAESQAKIEYLALHDPLTNLPNRKLFLIELKRAVTSAHRSGRKVGVLFLDLDNFKHINDIHGHRAGDQMLCELAHRIGEGLRCNDRLCKATTTRQGGDEFLILVEDLADNGSVQVIAQRLLDLLRSPFTVGAQQLRVTASLGITLYPDDGEDADTLIRNADLAMYKAKAQGKNNFHFFTDALNTASRRRSRIEQRLRLALSCDNLQLVYQPQFDCQTRRIVGCEALLRWQDEELGTVSPDEFIPIAESSGLIVEIGDWVLHTACQQSRRWQMLGLRPVVTGVNLSSVQVQNGQAASGIAAALMRSGLDAHLLDVEITESVIMETGEHSVALLEAIKSLGVSLSLDDFGTGYSSLSYLCRFPIDRLKIDRSFVAGINEDSGRQAIVSAILSLSQSLGLTVIAEGVETEEQMRFLTALGCDTAQGYLLGRPMSAEAFARLLAGDDDRTQAMAG